MTLSPKETAILFAALSTEIKSRELLHGQLEEPGTKELVEAQIQELYSLRKKVVGDYVHDH